MATLQKFKLLATQCGVAESPTRSPGTSPVVHFPRRKTTLRMLLTRSSSSSSPPRRFQAPPLPPPPEPAPRPSPEKKRDTLKDLFGSSLEGDGEENEEKGSELVGFGDKREQVFKLKRNYGLGGEPGCSSPRPGWVGLRHRSLLRRAWRPMLLAIPEN